MLLFILNLLNSWFAQQPGQKADSSLSLIGEGMVLLSHLEWPLFRGRVILGSAETEMDYSALLCWGKGTSLEIC